MTTRSAGGGTRRVSHGATSTSRALSTIPAAARCANHAASLATRSNVSAHTITRPASCTTAINGTAARLRISPAIVTLENVIAMTGSNAISTAADAATEAVSQAMTRDRGPEGPRRIIDEGPDRIID